MIDIRGPDPENAVVGKGSTITCGIRAHWDEDETFQMYINGVPYQDISAGDTWGEEANFDRKHYRYWEDYTMKTVIAGRISEFSQDHSGTEIRCVSTKWNKEISTTIDLQPAGSSK